MYTIHIFVPFYFVVLSLLLIFVVDRLRLCNRFKQVRPIAFALFYLGHNNKIKASAYGTSTLGLHRLW